MQAAVKVSITSSPTSTLDLFVEKASENGVAKCKLYWLIISMLALCLIISSVKCLKNERNRLLSSLLLGSV